MRETQGHNTRWPRKPHCATVRGGPSPEKMAAAVRSGNAGDRDAMKGVCPCSSRVRPSTLVTSFIPK